jgi:hypothetical protein
MRSTFVAAWCLVSIEAIAGDAPDPPVIYERVTVLDLPEVAVEAGVYRPDGVRVAERRPAQFSSMVVLRSNFDAELTASIVEID